jgi:hypothetical protein
MEAPPFPAAPSTLFGASTIAPRRYEPLANVTAQTRIAYALYLQAVQLGRQTTAKAFANSDDLYHRVTLPKEWQAETGSDIVK